MLQATNANIHATIPARGIKAISNWSEKNNISALDKMGVHANTLLNKYKEKGVQHSWAMDAGAPADGTTPLTSTGSVTTPVQFLQAWFPGYVYNMTAVRKIDDLIGMTIIGDWKDEQVVQGYMDVTGTVLPYGDTTSTNNSSWNANYNIITIARFESTVEVFTLEQERAAAIQIDSSATKRQGSMTAMEIQRNTIGFFGWNNGANQTYGFFNAPGLPSYQTVPFPNWATASYLQIVSDLLTAFALLQTQSQGNIDPEQMEITLALPTNSVAYLGTSTDFGYSVRKWLTDTYPKCRVVSAPQLNNANSGANVFYLYAEKFQGDSTDNGNVFDQCVQTKMRTLGVMQLTKSFMETHTNATAGVMLKRPWAVVRFTGI